MKADWKAKWIKALRSGKHKQAKEVLLAHNGAKCCLGVLRYLGDPRDRSDAAEQLTKQQLTQFGLTEMQQNNLAEMNDNGKTFNEIADYIKKRL